MKKVAFIIGSALLMVTGYSCKKKSSSENNNVAAAQIVIGTPVAPGNVGTSGGSSLTAIKGTMTSGNTYNLLGNIVVDAGDTLLLQSGVTVTVADGASIIVKGTLISLGTEAAPNTFTSVNSTAIKTNTVAQGMSSSTDPAYKGFWCGIECDTSCKLLDLKWTHIDFCGATSSNLQPFVGSSTTGASFNILFQTKTGNLIIEDCWFYGGVDDLVRVQCGNLHIMRNTVEKSGLVGGDGFNAKSGSVGDMAYNLIVGCATNGTKASNKGANSPPECNINMYNNTYVNAGYRQSGQVGRRGSMDIEQGAKGLVYNNLMVDCRTGLGIVNNPVADTANCHYGYCWSYCDSVNQLDLIYPLSCFTHPYTLAPTATQLGYLYPPSDSAAAGVGSKAYQAPSNLVGQNNPMFVGFTLPQATSSAYVAYVGSSDFHLQSGSPCIGKGYTGFSPLNATGTASASNPHPVTDSHFAATVTPPGVDMGCYQSNGNGNQH